MQGGKVGLTCVQKKIPQVMDKTTKKGNKMKKLLAEKLQSSWRWIHRGIFEYDSIRWCEKFGTIIEKPKKYSWIETEKKKWINVFDDSEEIVNWFIYHHYKHNRLDDFLI